MFLLTGVANSLPLGAETRTEEKRDSVEETKCNVIAASPQNPSSTTNSDDVVLPPKVLLKVVHQTDSIFFRTKTPVSLPTPIITTEWMWRSLAPTMHAQAASRQRHSRTMTTAQHLSLMSTAMSRMTTTMTKIRIITSTLSAFSARFAQANV